MLKFSANICFILDSGLVRPVQDRRQPPGMLLALAGTSAGARGLSFCTLYKTDCADSMTNVCMLQVVRWLPQ